MPELTWGSTKDGGIAVTAILLFSNKRADDGWGAYEERVFFSFIVRLINADDGIITLGRSL